MNKNIVRKGLVVGIILLFIGISAISSTANFLSVNISKDDKISSIPIDSMGIIYVDDDNTEGPWDGTLDYPYQFIQDGIDNAIEGDTVYVFNGIYDENVRINKTINLIGENKNTTVIDGNNIGDVINIRADLVNISRFTLRKSGEYDSGIDIVASKQCVVSNNIFLNNHLGVSIRTTKGNRNYITKNIIKNNCHGIELEKCSSNVISYNNISDNDNIGIYFFDAANNNDIICNNIIGNRIGIYLGVYSHETYVDENNIMNNGDIGITVYSSINVFSGNNIENNKNYGIRMSSSQNDIFSNNTFKNSKTAVYSSFDDSNHKFYYNNFIENSHMIRCGSCGHIFDYNYWDRPRVFPKMILGWKEKEIWRKGNIVFYINIPVFMFDMHPARVPNDI